MPNRRVLSVWFPRLGAERLLRREGHLAETPFAVVEDSANTQTLWSLSRAATAAGLYRGQPLRDALAMCAQLVTRHRNAPAEQAFLNVLHRWAGKFSPWVAQEPPDGLVIDLTGCAHLFGGEEALVDQVAEDCAGLGLSVRTGIADTLGAAWALARYGDADVAPHRSGDAIDQEARATRARAGKRRHWERGGAAPSRVAGGGGAGRIAPPGQTYGALSPLPVAALRLPPKTVEDLARLGLRRIGDLIGQPRAGLARRFGQDMVRRLDQAMGATPEPVSPMAPPDTFATRLSLPDPIGLEDDVMAAVDRMLPRLCARLRDRGRGLRSVRLEAYLTDGTMQWQTVSLAVPSYEADRIRPLLRMKVAEIEAGFGIDMLRLEVVHHEPIHDRRVVGHMDAGRMVRERLAANTAFDDLIGRLGARVGLDAITRWHPAQSHIPEKCATVHGVAWSKPADRWPDPPRPRPPFLFRPEPVHAPDRPRLTETFRWRGRTFHVSATQGPERISPEWWLDDPAWRSGVRDYWQVTTAEGPKLWLFYAHGNLMSSGWFCQGSFG